ncbi:cytochrome P450 [Sphingorhabdus buctiana]
MSSLMETNILDPEIFPAEQGPPHRLFDHWRENDPVHWNPANPGYLSRFPDSSGVKSFWVLTRYKDVQDVSMNQELFSSHEAGIVVWAVEGEALERQRANFMMMKPADHNAVKKVIIPPFMPKALAEIAPEIERMAAEIVASAAEKGQCEFVSEVAARLPIYTFCELMGIPPHLREQVAEYGNALADVENQTEQSLDPMMGLFALAQELAEEKRRNPDGRLLSAMVNDTTLNLDPMQINQFVLVFAMAGHETTRSTAAHFVYLMHKHPEQYALLRSDFDAHIDNAIDEVLRFTSTTTNFTRAATEDTEIGGYPVKKGDNIYLSYAAANRDPSIFEDPHRFDITRPNAKRHLAFGVGPHVCIGARLAKMQLRALLKEVVTRMPEIRLIGEPEWLRSVWFNAIIKMPVRF